MSNEVRLVSDHLALLAIVWAQPDITRQELAWKLGVSEPTAVSLRDDLVREGLAIYRRDGRGSLTTIVEFPADRPLLPSGLAHLPALPVLLFCGAYLARDHRAARTLPVVLRTLAAAFDVSVPASGLWLPERALPPSDS